MKVGKIIYLLIIFISIIITPFIVKYVTTHIRGYRAYGGEYLIPIFGWIIATIFYEVFKRIYNSEKFKARRDNDEQKHF